MLFLGTKKYPEEDSYSSFLTKHGGKYNAWTASESTNYMFDVGADHLEPALDLFAQFFIAPLFTESSTSREVQAIQAEHSKNLQSDLWRIQRLNGLLASPSHPQSKFGTGTSKTLEAHADLREQVMNFWKSHYSANIMKLAVIGKESLDELENYVRSKFADVENKNLKPYDEELCNGKPYDDERLASRVTAIPVAQVRRLSLAWTCKALNPLFRTKPDAYLSHLLGHEGEGSILSYLKEKGWAEALSAGPMIHVDHGLISVSVELSEEGVKHVNEITDVIYAYIALVKDHGISETLYSELTTINDLAFRFKDKEEPYSYVSSVAAYMQVYPPEYVLYGSRVSDVYDKNLIAEMLDSLVPSKMLMSVYDHSFKKVEGQEPSEFTPNMIEEHYGIEYRIDKIQPELISRWEKILHKTDIPTLNTLFTGLDIPKPNLFMPDDISILPSPGEEFKADAPPVIIEDTPTIRLWHKQDQTFQRPRSMLFLDFQSPVVYYAPSTVVKTKLFIDYISEELNEYGYDASIAGLKYSVTCTLQGFSIAISGYNCKQHTLLEKLLDRFRTLKIKKERLELLKSRAAKSYQNMDFQPAYAQANYQISLYMENPRWNYKQYEALLESMEPECIQSWIPQCLNAMYAEILAIGNISADQAKVLAALVQSKLQPKALMPGQFQQLRYVKLEEGVQYWVQRYAPNAAEKDCAIVNAYHTGPTSTQRKTTLELLNQIIEVSAYNTLRTQEQLGYIVACFTRTNHGVDSWNIIVQSPKVHPEFLDSRVEAWMATVHQFISDLPQEEFEHHRLSLIQTKREKFTSLRKEAGNHWSAIMPPHTYQFDELEQAAKILEKMTKEDVLVWWDMYFAPGATHRAKLSMQNWAKPHELSIPSNPAEPIVVVKDPFLFKGRMPLHSVKSMGKERVTPAEYEVATAGDK
jgi:insulysin